MALLIIQQSVHIAQLLDYFIQMGGHRKVFIKNIYCLQNRQCESTMKHIVEKFQLIATVGDETIEKYSRSVRLQENINWVL